MAVFNEPTQWDHELGNNADVSTLPDDTSATTGLASLQKLFQIINQTPLQAGGVAPNREDINALFKLLGGSVFYAMNGGFASYNPAYDYVVGRYVVYNNTLYKCIQANGASSTVVAPDSVSPLGSDYWKDIENQDSTSLIPNQTIVSELPLTDANLHLKDGALLSGSGAYSEYVDLIAEIYNSGDATTSFCTEAEWQTSNTNYGFCNKFVYDSVANTVRLPKINSEHGALIKSVVNGANGYRIYQDGFCEQWGRTETETTTASFLISFSNTNYFLTYSPLGNNSATSWRAIATKNVDSFILSNALVMNWTAIGYTDISDLQTAPIYEYIVVGTVSKTQIQIDIDNVMADLALKADKDFSNVTAPVQAFKDMSIEWGQPDWSASILIESGNISYSYTAPSDGFLLWNNNNSNVVINNVTFVIAGNDASNQGPIMIPLHKNDTVSATNDAGSNVYFIPCKGAN